MINKKNLYFIFLISVMILISCDKEELTGTNISQLFHLEHKGSTMPILVEGNIDSKVIVLMLHGGPGGSTRHINRILTKYTDPLEEKYAVAYWDQRMAGCSRQNSSELTIELMTEDTDKVIDLLKYKFGYDTKIFLLGHSWGGMLGTSYLLDSNRQQKISGWIEVCGAHDLPKTTKDALGLIFEVANKQISKTINTEKWSQMIDGMSGIDSNNILIDEVFEINQNGYIAVKIAIEDGLINNEFIESDESWNTIYHGLFGEYSYTANTSNRTQLFKSELWKEGLWSKGLSLSNQLHKISIPSLFIYGKYDFVVPSSQGIDAYNKVSTLDKDKTIVILEHSGHLPFDSEVDLFLNHLISFIDEHK